MLKFLKAFFIFTILYHILVTLVCYGFFGGQYPQIPALVRESVWVLFMVIITIAHRRSLMSYAKQWKYPWIFFCGVILFGLGISWLQDKSFSDMFIGIKYGFWYLFIFLSTSIVGYLIAQRKQGEEQMRRFLFFVIKTLLVVVVAGLLWQGLKLMWPDLFFQLGYGTLNDFKFGDKPPIYYLTGLGGTLRWQGLFAGPNNYGYFLVAFLPVIVYLIKKGFSGLAGWKKHIPQLFLLLWILAIVMTLSRSAIVGSVVVLAIVFKSWIRKHRKIGLGLLVICLLGLVGLSVLKGTSTLAHITAKFSSLSYVINQPLGYGLGSSGPAIHHNGNMLPENYFIQLMIDIGTIGFLIWAFCISQMGAIINKIKTVRHEDIKNDGTLIYQIRKGLTIGWIALLVMGMFLHVFEDSMVNYTFFLVWGVTTGYLSYGLKGVKIGLREFWKKNSKF